MKGMPMYKILIGRTPRELSMEVNLAIKAGYNLYGEFTITDKLLIKLVN